MSTVIVKVDLDCQRCYKKISKTICKIQDKMNIQNIVFDEKNNTVTISGPFDPKKLSKKLCCKAGNVIIDIQIKEKEKPKEPKPAEPVEPKKDKPKEPKPAEPVEPKKDKPKDDKPAEPKKDKPKNPEPKKDDKPAEPKKDKPKDDKPAEPKKDKPTAGPAKPEPVPQPVWTGPGCGCTCRPPYEGYYYGDNRCCWCGRGYGCMPLGPPPMICGPQPVVCGAPVYGGYNSCTFICEEDPQSCSIM